MGSSTKLNDRDGHRMKSSHKKTSHSSSRNDHHSDKERYGKKSKYSSRKTKVEKSHLKSEDLKEHQIAEKRAVLWTKKKEKSPNEPKDEKETLKVIQESSCNETDKFRRLLGVKSSETNQIFEKKFLGNPSSNTVLNYGLDYEYEKARVKTHQNRGSGLGFYK